MSFKRAATVIQGLSTRGYPMVVNMDYESMLFTLKR
jgi:hypothetical protein